MTIQLLTLVALWCGNPVVQAGDGGPIITIEEVNQCRQKLIACMKNEILDNTPGVRDTLEEQAANNCIIHAQMPYPGKDN